MAKAKLPAIQWYPKDWQSDMGIQSLSFEERGIWWEILQRMHQSEERGKMVLNGRPMTDYEIANIIHCEVAKFKQSIQQILSKGVASRDEFGTLISRRMVYDENIRRVRAIAGAEGGKQTQSKRQAKRKQKSTPSSPIAVPIAIPEDLLKDKEAIELWIAYKQERHDYYKARGLGALWGVLRRIPQEKRKEAIEHSMAGGYKGIFEPKNYGGQLNANDRISGAAGYQPDKYARATQKQAGSRGSGDGNEGSSAGGKTAGLDESRAVPEVR